MQRWLAAAWVLSVVGTARAQPSEPEPAPAAVVTPPRVVALPEVELPPDAEVPEGGAVELRLLVRADGTAAVEECSATDEVCARVRAAVEAGRFEPATRDGAPVPAQIAMRFRVRALAPEPEEPPASSETTPEEGAPAAAPEVLEDTVGFRTTATVEPVPRGAMRLELEELRDMPGAFGDPFRAIEALPGVTPIFSGLPYFYVRGAPPSGTLYVYDDIPLPALYHLGLGPAVVHARMIGPLRLHTGVPPARFGRFTGGVIEAEGPAPPEDDDPHGEVELRLLDLTSMVQAEVGGGRLAVAGRYGYPGLLLSIFSPEVDLAYWDYQLRFEHPLGRRDSVEIVWLGSYDALTTTNEVDGAVGEDATETSALTIQFHRFEARLVRRLRRFELGTALRVGWEESSLDEEIALEAFTLGPRMWMALDEGAFRLRVGLEMIGAAGGMRFVQETSEDDGDAPQDPARNEVYASVAARNMAAVYAELAFDPIDALTIDLGLRGDVWVTGSAVEASLDPRARATWHATGALDLHAAVGVTRQPAVFFIPLPGLAEVAVDHGLQTATQGEVGASARLPLGLEAEGQLFVHHYQNLLFPDLFVNDETCTPTVCVEVPVNPRVDGMSYGAELFLRRDPSERLAGFVSYTLAWAETEDVGDIDYSPSYDVRHVLNVAGRWDIGGGFSAGLRFHLRSGKPMGRFYLDDADFVLRRYEQRLPAFHRLDAQVAYGWETSWGRMRLALEWFNVTFSEEPVDIRCVGDMAPSSGECPVQYAPAIVVPNLGLRAVF